MTVDPERHLNRFAHRSSNVRDVMRQAAAVGIAQNYSLWTTGGCRLQSCQSVIRIAAIAVEKVFGVIHNKRNSGRKITDTVCDDLEILVETHPQCVGHV